MMRMTRFVAAGACLAATACAETAAPEPLETGVDVAPTSSTLPLNSTAPAEAVNNSTAPVEAEEAQVETTQDAETQTVEDEEVDGMDMDMENGNEEMPEGEMPEGGMPDVDMEKLMGFLDTMQNNPDMVKNGELPADLVEFFEKLGITQEQLKTEFEAMQEHEADGSHSPDTPPTPEEEEAQLDAMDDDEEETDVVVEEAEGDVAGAHEVPTNSTQPLDLEEQQELRVDEEGKVSVAVLDNLKFYYEKAQAFVQKALEEIQKEDVKSILSICMIVLSIFLMGFGLFGGKSSKKAAVKKVEEEEKAEEKKVEDASEAAGSAGGEAKKRTVKRRNE